VDSPVIVGAEFFSCIVKSHITGNSLAEIWFCSKSKVHSEATLTQKKLIQNRLKSAQTYPQTLPQSFACLFFFTYYYS